MRSSIWHSFRIPALALVLCGLATTSQAQEASKPRRITLGDLLVSDLPAEVAKGEAELKARRSEIIAGHLKTIDAGDPEASGAASAELAVLISPWLRGRESSARFHEGTTFETVGRPVVRQSGIPEAADIRRSLHASLPKLLELPKGQPGEDYHFRTMQAVASQCELLAEVADDATIDWALELLGKGHAPHVIEPLVRFVSSSMGIPRVYMEAGLCGNSTPEEMAAFQRKEQEEFQAARLKLAGIWKELKPMGQQERIAYAIKAWREQLLPKPESQVATYLISEKWIHVEMEPLVRLGPPAVDQLRAQQAQETDLLAKGVWETVITAITGKEDKDMVRSLFDTPGTSNSAPMVMACQIIMAAGSKDWLADLDALQTRQYADGGKASQVIASCHREEGIPALKRAFEANPHNFHAQYSIKELELRAEKGSPRSMRRRF